MKSFKLKKLSILLTFVLFSVLSFAQSDVIGINMENDLKEKARKAVQTYYDGLMVLGSLQDANVRQQLQQDALTFFENRSVLVYNDLITGSQSITVEEYVENIPYLYPNPDFLIEGFVENLNNSTIYYDNNSLLVKVIVNVSIKGTNRNGEWVNKTNRLNALVKYVKTGDRINTSPKIFNILGNEEYDGDKLSGFKPILVSTNETNTSYTADNTEYNEKIRIIQETEARLIQEEENIRIRKEELSRREMELEDEKIIAEMKRQKAEQERIEAERQIEIARLAKEEAERQRIEAERQRAEAERQRAEAEAARLEAEQKALLLKSERFVINVGAGIYKHTGLLEQVINKQETTQGFATQINATLGYRFDINVNNNAARKINRGTIFGAFVRYGINSQEIINSNNLNQSLQIPEDKLDPILNHYMEFEAGFVFSELLRTSFGVGKQYDKRYFASTLALNINFGKLVWEIGATGMFGKDFQKLQIRPTTSLAFQFNELNPKKIKEPKSGFLCFELNPEVAYNMPISSTKGTAVTNSLSYQTTAFLGFKISKRSKIGVFGTYGISPNGISQNILESNELQTSYSINGDYNPYSGAEAGLIIKGMRISYGIGEFSFLNNQKLPYQSLSIGYDMPIFRVLRFTLNTSTIILNENYSNPILRISTGLALRFNYAR